MIWAFGRLILIAFTTIFCLLLAVFGLRFLSGQQLHSELKHPLIADKPWLIADGGDLDFGPSQSLPALVAANKISPAVFLGLRIRLSQDGHWLLYAPRTLEELTDGHGHLSRLTLGEIRKVRFKVPSAGSILTLDETLQAFPGAYFYIEVLQPGSTGTEILFSLLKKHKLEDRVVLTSPFMDTLREIREESAVWLTGTSTSETAKAYFTTSIFLEPVIHLPGEVFVANKFVPRLFSELSNRKKVLIFETQKPEEFAEIRKNFPRMGALTKRPTQFTQIVAQKVFSH